MFRFIFFDAFSRGFGEECVDAVESFATGGGVAAGGIDGVFVFEERIEMPGIAIENPFSIRYFP